MKKINKDIIFCSIAVLLSVIGLFVLYYFVNDISDGRNGADSSDSAAALFVRSLAKNDGKTSRYLMKDTREKGFVFDAMSLSPISSLRSDYSSVDIDNIVISGIDDLSDKLDKLSGGYFSGYNVDVSFDNAKRYLVSANYDCFRDDSSDVVSGQLLFNIITVKLSSNKKWYVYTGQQLSEDLDRSDADLVNIVNEKTSVSSDGELEDENLDEFDIVYTKIQAVSKNIKKLNFYQGAADDLIKGKISIDSFEYFMPISYDSIMNFMSISDAKITADNMVVAANSITKHVPVSFTNIIYGMTGIDISIGNPTNNPIDIYSGILTGLYIAIPDQDIYDYPDVYLPGNVTFGTDFNDVMRMYGGLEPYQGGNSDLKLYSDSVTVYQKTLNHDKNYVYFEFDNNKLVAIQFYYFDLSA